ncbi:MAG: cell division protein FtsK [Alphaproteobacteria bacterium HGW-Alphaproteobacteria-2]|nr:MAG: cell division protein FtsK [Alphaproteobacteria bacterium HGW-Alphaproteobacteria-2]
MAYQSRHQTRDPLISQTLQVALQRRGRELLGLSLLGLGGGVVLILGSYVPDDPSWLSASDEPAKNLLGQFGATVASPLIITIGLGAWTLAALLLGWGVRLVTHRGTARSLGRLVFAPLVVALAALFAATHVPGPGWGHSFGLGGLFGDAVLGAALGVMPLDAASALRVASLAAGAALLASLVHVLGVTRRELRELLRFLGLSLLRVLAQILRLGTRAVARAAERPSRSMPQETARAVEKHVLRVPAMSEATHRAAAPRPGLRERLPRLSLRRTAPMPEPELVESSSTSSRDAGIPDAERIRGKITDVIRARSRRDRTPDAGGTLRRVEPPLFATATVPAVPAAAGDVAAAVELPPFTSRKVVEPVAPRPAAPSRRAQAEAQPAFTFDEPPVPAYVPPPLSLLAPPAPAPRQNLSEAALHENARMLEAVLDDYGVKGEILRVKPGPVVTMYELEPAPGLKASRVIGLSDDIARSMSALSARVSTVPGRSVIGIELPNEVREKVLLREILSTREFGDGQGRLPLALGKDISGAPVVVNLAKMPHLLIAGTTGSGKSVAINTMILSLLYKLSPEDCRLIMIDPKMLELSVYDGIPHLLSPVVTDPKKAVVALKWVVAEMEERYRRMSKMGVRNIEGYNGRVRDALDRGEMFSRTVQTGFDDATGDPVFETEEFAPETLPYIVVVVDEMADLMMVAGKEIEACIQRLAQMARASGIHLIMATQRPSVDVITGTIKANFPTRISFQVTSKIDSRTILGEQGAEQLLGQGDMLYMAGGARITRVHGPFVSDEEVEEVVAHLKSYGVPDYVQGVLEGPEGDRESAIDDVLGLGGGEGEDALYDQAVAVVLNDRKCSTSYIQRKLGVGYNKAARLVEQMEEQGLVSPANHVGKREILVPERD